MGFLLITTPPVHDLEDSMTAQVVCVPYMIKQAFKKFANHRVTIRLRYGAKNLGPSPRVSTTPQGAGGAFRWVLVRLLAPLFHPQPLAVQHVLCTY